MICSNCKINFQISNHRLREATKRNSKNLFCNRACYEDWRTRKSQDTLVERFWEKVNKEPGQGPKGDCWEWRDSEGDYGDIKLNGRDFRAHRISYWLENPEFDLLNTSLFVCHSCDNRPCINPSHLFLGTHQDNFQDMLKKKRHIQGSKVPNSKLKEDDVIEICKLYFKQNIGIKEIAKGYNVDYDTITSILDGTSWKSVPRQERRSRKPKLKSSEVILIKVLLNEKVDRKDIAKRFNVGRWVIDNIASGKTWKETTISCCGILEVPLSSKQM